MPMKMSYGRNFWMLCFSMFLFMTSFNLILPELNQFITDLGGEDQKGWIITLFTISALISRPFSGKLSDVIGRRKVIFIGIIIAISVCLLYPLSTSVWFFLGLRFVHGFSAGFSPTGATALVADILPATKRGQGMGIWGTFISLGFGGGQVLATPIQTSFGMNGLFICASLIAVSSGLLLYSVRETLDDPERFKFSFLKINAADLFDFHVMPAAMVMFLTATCSGIVLAVNPDVTEFFGIENKGYFMGLYSVSTIGIRLFTSKLSDVYGRRKALLVGVLFLIASMALIALAESQITYTISAIMFGIATGVCSPTLFAWTADLSHPERRGVGTGTLFIALELGVGFGAWSTLWFYDNTRDSILLVFGFAVFMSLLATAYLIWHLRKKSSAT